MSIVAITVSTVSGALSKATSTDEIFVAKGEKSKVVMTGYIGGPRVQGEDGKYRAETYGRLPVQAAVAGEGDKRRYVLEIAGGLRGVLFQTRNKQNDKAPDYSGNIDLGDTQMPLFGRKKHSENGDFISLSSKEAQPKDNGSNHAADNPQPAAAPEPEFEDDDIPF